MIIYFDENMPPHLAEGFQIIQFPEGYKFGYNIEVKYLPDSFDYGVKDLDWIPQVGKERSCVITQDLNISRRKDELALFHNNGVGMFFLRGASRKKGMTVWEMTIALAKNWEEITRIASTEQGPFAYQFYLNRKMKKM